MTNPMRLILLRHAKSSWNDLGVKDHQRPLNARGQRDAPRIGARLAELGWSPDHVVSSDSRRTRETWSLLAPAFGAEAPTPQWLSTLYLGDLDAILDALGEAPAESRCVLALGHNPGWEAAN